LTRPQFQFNAEQALPAKNEAQSLNTKRITAAAIQINQKLAHKRGFECNGERRLGGR
jgi:hypothetical protein